MRVELAIVTGARTPQHLSSRGRAATPGDYPSGDWLKMRFHISILVVLISTFPTLVSAADANGYTAQYECRSGGPDCNVDVAGLTQQACQQTITTSDSASTISSKINGGSQFICVQPGDYTGIGTISITASGSSGARKVLRYYRPGDSDDQPWNQTSSGNQAKMSEIELTGNYWIVHRLTLPSNTHSGLARFYVTGPNNILNRILVEGPGGTDACQSGVNFQASGNVLQNSVVRDARRCTTGSPVAVSLENGDNLRVINNEISNWCEHQIQVGQNNIPSSAGTVVENNDLYLTLLLDRSRLRGAKRRRSMSFVSHCVLPF